MKKSIGLISGLSVLIISSLLIAGCKKKDNPIKFPYGTFPDSVYNLSGLNSPYDDYNSDLYILSSKIPIIFSSNRKSTGGQFDLVQGDIWYQFDQTNAKFSLGSEITNDAIFAALINKAITSGNDFGPYSYFSSTDGYDYLFLASQNGNSQLDIFYLKYLPPYGTAVPDITGPTAAKLLNSGFDEGYISFNLNGDTAYFMSNRNGNYDILLQKKAPSIILDTWLKQDFAAATTVDSVNSVYDDKCPFVYQNIMLFSSNRPGGMGGYDLYYSVFRNGKWNSPVNMGPRINTSSDEYRPVLGYNQDFTNMFMVFSSNKPGGLGGYDLYFTGFTFK